MINVNTLDAGKYLDIVYAGNIAFRAGELEDDATGALGQQGQILEVAVVERH